LGRILDIRLADQLLEQAVQLLWCEPDLAEVRERGIAIRGKPLEVQVPELAAQTQLLRAERFTERWIQPGIERTLAQKSRAECVDRAEECAIDLAQRSINACDRVVTA